MSNRIKDLIEISKEAEGILEVKEKTLAQRIAKIVKEANISDRFKFLDLLDELSNLVDEKDDLYKILSALFDAVEV